MIAKPSQTRILAALALAFAVMALGGCPTETGDPAAPSSEWADLSDFIAEFVRSALAAWAL
ncbi:MAG: hypothetical protein HRU75_11565 [Planctomycetia bacterium]|nr:MAG: hypothetical protein HRU75_11565 [Planctomycetia bacterium]